MFNAPAHTLRAKYNPQIILNQPGHIIKKLPPNSQIEVFENEEITPQTIIASIPQGEGFLRTNLAKQLDLGPKEASKYLRKSKGDFVKKGDILALKAGKLVHKQVNSPADGILKDYDPTSGELLIKVFAQKKAIFSPVFGIIDNVDHQKKELQIKVISDEIFGFASFGQPKEGTLSLSSFSGLDTILVSGSLISAQLMNKVSQLKISGLIAGGITAREFQLVKMHQHNLITSLFITEGIGLNPINKDIFNLLKAHENFFTILNPKANHLILPSVSQGSILTLRKISLPKIAKAEAKSVGLKEIQIGSKVRSKTLSNKSKVEGFVLAIDKTETLLKNGVFTYLVTIETSHRKIKVPYQNLELI